MDELKHYEFENDGDVLIVVARASLTSAVDTDLVADRHRLVEHITGQGITQVVVDFRRVTHFASSVLNTLTHLWNSQRTAGGRMAVCSLSQLARETISMAGLDTILDLCPTQSEALARVRT